MFVTLEYGILNMYDDVINNVEIHATLEEAITYAAKRLECFGVKDAENHILLEDECKKGYNSHGVWFVIEERQFIQ